MTVFPLTVPNFESTQLEIRQTTLGSPKLFANDERVAVKRRKFTVVDDQGQPVEGELGGNVIGGPYVLINGVKHGPGAVPVEVWEYLVFGLPCLLILGGLLGGLAGMFGVLANLHLRGSSLPTPVKIGAAIVVFIASAVAYVVMAGAFANAVA